MEMLNVEAMLAEIMTSDRPHIPRSEPYKAGVSAGLQMRHAGGKYRAVCPHEVPSAEADAWWSGCDRGFAEYHRFVSRAKAGEVSKILDGDD